MTIPFQEYQVFFFDLDGLLLDTEPLYYRACVQVCRQYIPDFDMDFPTYYQLAMLGREEFQRQVVARFPAMASCFPRYFIEREEAYRDLIQKESPLLLPGVEAFLHYLVAQNKSWGIVTNTGRSFVDSFVRTSPILHSAHFSVTREEYTRPKPYGDSYQYAYRRFVDKGERVIGFEDSMKGLRALATIPATLVCINSMYSLSQDSHKDFKDREFYYYPSFLDLITHCGVQNQQ